MAESIRALLVEDSEDDYKLIMHALKSAGFIVDHVRVATSQDMEKALQLPWDIVLSDYSLPGFSGLEALSLARKYYKDIPFIVVSGTIGEEAAVDIMIAGANDYVMKNKLARLQMAIRREVEVSRNRKKNLETEKTLKDTEEQLRQSQKMEAIGQLAGGVAHDYNNILTVLQAYYERLAQLNDIKIKPYLDKIMKAHKRAINLTRQLLIFSRKQVGQPAILSLNHVIADFQEMLQRLLGESIEISYDFASSNPQIKIDPGHIEQIIMNLSVNARDAMPKGGQIYITTKVIDVSDVIFTEKSDFPRGEYILLRIKDTGSGIEKSVMDRIFEPFFTTKPVGKGTGLGLSIVYGIIHQNQGRIFVSSEVGMGTTFDIYLPTASETDKNAFEAMEPKSMPVLDTDKNSGTVLLVEDEPDLRELMGSILEDSGFKVLVAADGYQAIKTIETHKGSPIQLVITDVVMPKMGGVDLFHKIKGQNRNIQFLYMSGHAAVTVAADATHLFSAKNFLEKPFSGEDLVKKVRSILTP